MTSALRLAAIVTGASSGIGAACARRMSREGIAVALAARRQPLLDELAVELATTGGRVLAMAADVTDEGAMRTLASRALAAFGRLDILVCSAGIGYQGALEDTPPTVLQRLLDVNVVGTLNAIRAVLPYFVSQRDGRIVVIGSIVGKRGIPGYTAYSASKFAQAGLAEALRAELRDTGVTVTTVVPVSARTGFRDAMAREFGVHVTGAGPAQSVEDVADAVMRALRHGAPEVYALRRARLLVLLNACFPRLADRVAARFARGRVDTEPGPADSDAAESR